MAVDLNGVSRTRMQDAVPTVIPSRVPYAGKLKAKARWTLVHPTKGYMEDCRDECLSHLSDVALETGWLRLTSIGRAEDQNVSVTLQQPQGTEERQSIKLKTDEGRLRQEDLRASASTQNSNRKSSRKKAKKKTVSGLTTAANMRWNVHLAMLATSKDGGETTAENKANERTLLRAQEQVFASRRRREMRRDEFVTNISRNMKLTYARAENAIAKIKLKDRLYKDISDASFFSEELSSSTMKRRSSQSNLAEDVPPLKTILHSMRQP